MRSPLLTSHVLRLLKIRSDVTLNREKKGHKGERRSPDYLPFHEAGAHKLASRKEEKGHGWTEDQSRQVGQRGIFTREVKASGPQSGEKGPRALVQWAKEKLSQGSTHRGVSATRRPS